MQPMNIHACAVNHIQTVELTPSRPVVFGNEFSRAIALYINNLEIRISPVIFLIS